MKFIKGKVVKFAVTSIIVGLGAYFGVSPTAIAPIADQLGAQAEEMVEG